MGSQRVGHNWATELNLCLFSGIHFHFSAPFHPEIFIEPLLRAGRCCRCSIDWKRVTAVSAFWGTLDPERQHQGENITKTRKMRQNNKKWPWMGLGTPSGNSSPRRIPKLAWVDTVSLWTKPGAGHFTPTNYHHLEWGQWIGKSLAHNPCPAQTPLLNPLGWRPVITHTHIPHNNCSAASPLQVPSEKGLHVCLGHHCILSTWHRPA